MTLETFGTLLVGAFLALLGGLATTYFVRWQRRRDSHLVIFLELEDLRGLLATVHFMILQKIGRLDVKSLRWFIPVALDHKSPESPPREALSRMAAKTDEELQMDVDAFNAFNAAQKQTGINLKTYGLQFTDAHLSDVALFAPLLQKSILDIRSSLKLFNADVNLAMSLHKKTYDVGMTKESVDDIWKAVQAIYEALGIRAKQISEQCAEILKHKDC